MKETKKKRITSISEALEDVQRRVNRRGAKEDLRALEKEKREYLKRHKYGVLQ